MSEHETALRRWLIEYKRRGGAHSASLEGLLNGLMEEHRKALEAERGARLSAERDLRAAHELSAAWAANMREIEWALGVDAPDGITPAEVRKALVRARNEGIRAAAEVCREEGRNDLAACVEDLLPQPEEPEE